MAVIEKIKKFVKDITPPSKEQKAKIEAHNVSSNSLIWITIKIQRIYKF